MHNETEDKRRVGTQRTQSSWVVNDNIFKILYTVNKSLYIFVYSFELQFSKLSRVDKATDFEY